MQICKTTLIILSLFFASHTFATNCSGDNCFSPHSTLSSQQLALRGISTLRYWGFKVYTAALYLQKGLDPMDDSPKSLTLHYYRDFSAEDFQKSGRKVAQDNPEVNFQQVLAGFDEIDRLYRSVKDGDRYTLTYIPSVGTQLYLNDQLLGTVAGYEFAKAYFSIWLSDKYSLDTSFTARLLNDENT